MANPFNPFRSEAEFVSFFKTIINDVVMPDVRKMIEQAVKQEVRTYVFPNYKEDVIGKVIKDEVQQHFARIYELAKQCDDTVANLS